MVQKGVFCQDMSFFCQYHNGKTYNYEARFNEPKQDRPELCGVIRERLKKFQLAHRCEPVLNEHLRRMCVAVFRFIPAEVVPLSLFGNNDRKGKFRQTLYDLKAKFVTDMLIGATDLRDDPVYKDVIGFENIKDL